MPVPNPRSRGAAAVILAALLCAACGRAPAPPPSGDTLVLRNFTLIDGDRPAVRDAAMIVDAGRISWIGPASDLRAPENAATRDLAGAFVIPGLIDLHAHIGNTVDLVQ